METIKVPKDVLQSIEDTLSRWAIAYESHKKETCLDRDTIGNINCCRKLLKGEPLTGWERLEK